MRGKYTRIMARIITISTALVFVAYFFIKLPDIVHSAPQSDIDKIASNLDLRYKVVDNLGDPKFFSATLSLKNKGSTPITEGDWFVYFCHIRQIRQTKRKQTIQFQHVNGCVHRFYPTPDFEDLAPGSTLTITIIADHWEIARSDVMPNWYVTSPGSKAKAIESTKGEGLDFVAPFLTREQWKRFKGDVYDPYTAQSRYDKVEIDKVDEKEIPILIPQPVSIAGFERGSRVTVDQEWKVYADSAVKKEAQALANQFKAGLVTSAPSQSTKIIRVTIADPDVTINGAKSTSDEAYSLTVDVTTPNINIIGKTNKGVFYGVQSLLALAGKDNTVPKVTIKDAPRFGYRGMHLDVGRNFMPKSAVLRLLDVMAMYKLNKFHFHLTDDEGWRLEIPDLPELTTVGSKRCYDPTGDKCIQTDLGSDPDEPTTPMYYTVADYKEILQYANDRHIQVIPEFDMPGHGYAAIKAMEARARKLNKTGDSVGAAKYLLTEQNDPSQYLSVQLFKDDAINPCLQSTYNFIDKLVEQVAKLHAGIQPLTIYHFGGDEVAHGAWKKSSVCEKLAEAQGLNFSASDIVDKLKDYFVQRVSNITHFSYGISSLAGWEDGLLGVGDKPYNRGFLANKDVYAFTWNNIWEWGAGKRAYQLANAGFKVVLTPATHLYFDHPQEPDPEERGYYWATRFTDTRKVFGFIPDDLFANVETKRSGEKFTRQQLCAKFGECIELKEKQNVVGIAGALWTETVRTPDQMDSMIYPRLIALAERAWHKASWEGVKDDVERNTKRTEDWAKFASALGGREMERLDKLGVKYYVPPPGARLVNNKLKVRTIMPGLPVQYSQDGGNIWRDVTTETVLEGTTKLQTLSADRKRSSRVVLIQGPAKANASSISIATGLIQTIAVLKLAYKFMPQ